MTNSDQATPSAPPKDAPGPFDGLKDAFRGLGKTVFDAGVHRAGGLTDRLTSRLTDFAEGKKEEAEESDAPGPVANAVKEGVVAKVEGENPATAAIKGALGGVKNKLTGGKAGKDSGQKYVNIVEWIDVGVPVRVAYNQWTEFEQWTSFMKKVENVQRNEDQGQVAFKARVFLSHRSWESSIVEMVPDHHIVWQSTGQKGYLNGGVTFHELTPNLTRMCVVVEYHPQGVVEKTLQIWRSVGRAVRRELKRYVHQVMTHTILDPDGVEGWRAEIRDKEIVRSHDEVVEQEQQEAEAAEQDEQEAPQGAADEQAADEAESPQDEDEEGDESDESDEDASEEEPAAESEDEYDESEQEEEPATGDEEAYEDEQSDDAEDEEQSEGGDAEDESHQGEDEYDDEGSDEERSDDEDEEQSDEADAEDEYEDESDEEGSADDEYESEDEQDDEGAEDEYEDEGDEDEGAEDEYDDEGDEDEDEETGEESEEEGSGNDDGDRQGSGTPTPRDVASGSVHPTETRRPRTKQRA